MKQFPHALEEHTDYIAETVPIEDQCQSQTQEHQTCLSGRTSPADVEEKRVNGGHEGQGDGLFVQAQNGHPSQDQVRQRPQPGNGVNGCQV